MIRSDCPRDFALSLVEQGLISAEDMLLISLSWQSWDDVRGMLEHNGLLDLDEDYE